MNDIFASTMSNFNQVFAHNTSPLSPPEAVRIANASQDVFSTEFLEWLPQNLAIYYAFSKQALEIIARGRKHYSARTIVEFLRHHTALQENPAGEWKINDHSVPYLARLFDLMYPRHAGLFEYRKTTKEKGVSHG